MGCQSEAIVEIAGGDPYGHTFSCGEHLVQMIEPDGNVVTPYDGGMRCCFISAE